MMDRVLIIGGAGFIGLSLARALHQDGLYIDLLDDFSRGKNDQALAALLAHPGVGCIQLDLSGSGASEALEDSYDVVFHFAALLGVRNVLARPYETLTANVRLTIEALRLARRQRHLTSFVFASTSEVYAGSLRAGHLELPTPEDVPIALLPLNDRRSTYMMSKLYGEALVQHAEIPAIIIRPHNVYGPRMGSEHVVPELLQKMHRAMPGSEIAIASAHHTRTFCYIDDCVEMVRRLAFSHEAVGEVWNVGTQEPEYRIMEAAEIIRDVVGSDLRLVPGAETPGSPVRRCPSMRKTGALTDYYSRVPFEVGVARTYEWYRKEWN
jgi:UDP-glucose 4-epimerase